MRSKNPFGVCERTLRTFGIELRDSFLRPCKRLFYDGDIVRIVRTRRSARACGNDMNSACAAPLLEGVRRLLGRFRQPDDRRIHDPITSFSSFWPWPPVSSFLGRAFLQRPTA